MSNFNPDWLSPPGDTISDLLEERVLSRIEFAQHLGYAPDQLDDLIRGLTPITASLAKKLEHKLGASASFWMNRESKYRKAIDRLKEKGQHDEQISWLNALPIKDMVTFGWIEPHTSTKDQLKACLDFFAVSNTNDWNKRYQTVIEQSAFRTSPTYESKPGAVTAWLRRGEIEGSTTTCSDWNAKKFYETLQEIRIFTRQRDPNIFLPELTSICAQCGVSVAIVRAPSGCRASGATRFLSPNKALLLLSFRYLSDDHFWFTFFHEAAHLLLHGKQSLFLEGGKIEDAREKEANDFSARILIPENFRSELEQLPIDKHAIRHFAKKLGVSPGIVLGQLQHLGRAQLNELNNLKARFKWE